ncbi:MAG TPA: aldo/keto reductase [Mycobacteriales bacterium]|nr:aldo/keto reductase [Mycobacteriales bacterium]
MLVYGPLAHGILSGALREDRHFAAGDWRASSPDFRGEAYRRNLAAATELERLAHDQLGISLSQLAIAWNPPARRSASRASAPETRTTSTRLSPPPM